MSAGKFYIWTVGCQMNVADSERLAAGLTRLGWQPTDSPEDASLAVVNTCSVRQHAEDRAYSKLGRLRDIKSDQPNLKIAVMGCMVGPKTGELKHRFPYVDAFARPQQFGPIMSLVETPAEDLGGEFWPTTYAIPTGPTAFVPVIHGCNKFCTYCIVPYRRGREASRPIEEIRSEIEQLTAQGVREVTLLGQTVEAYGHDLTGEPDLGDLMRSLADLPQLLRIRFLTSYPKDMTGRILEAVAEIPKVMESFSLPVQSGSDRVLDSMRRGYRREEFISKVREVRKLMPEAGITTDVITGYPGESEADFEETCSLLEELRFDKVHVAAYSPRKGTIAYKQLPDDVSPDTKLDRLHRVEAIEHRISLELNERMIGKSEPILIEGLRGDQPFGRTRAGRLVHLDAPARTGSVVDVRIEHAGAFSLRGAAADALALT